LIPDASRPIPAVFLRAPTYYPLIYRKRVKRVDDQARPGDLVAVYCQSESDEPAALIGYGLYNPRSEIVVRLVRCGRQLPDGNFWDTTLARAVQLRREVLRLDEVTNAYRVLHAEADGVPGLVVDRLGDTLSAEAFSLGMFQRCGEILARLERLCGTQHTLIQPGPNVLAQEGFDAEPRASEALPASVLMRSTVRGFEFGLTAGHKTGFFCDQRDNRRQLAGFCVGGACWICAVTPAGFAIQPNVSVRLPM
jgi:23S rRNA (cytosine1962-C5)-methyltransferase